MRQTNHQRFEACRARFAALREGAEPRVEAFWTYVQRILRKSMISGREFGLRIILSDDFYIQVTGAFDPTATDPEALWNSFVIGIDGVRIPMTVLESQLEGVESYGIVMRDGEVITAAMVHEIKIPEIELSRLAQGNLMDA